MVARRAAGPDPDALPWECPHCSRPVRVPLEDVNAYVICPLCNGGFRTPADMEQPPEPLPHSKTDGKVAFVLALTGLVGIYVGPILGAEFSRGAAADVWIGIAIAVGIGVCSPLGLVRAERAKRARRRRGLEVDGLTRAAAAIGIVGTGFLALPALFLVAGALLRIVRLF